MGKTKTLTESERGALNLYLNLLGVKHTLVREHCCRVGLHSARVARRLQKDVKAAYLGGIYHDIGKALLDGDLFSGRDVTDEEYKQIQSHAKMGYDALKDLMLFTSLCCGFHHALSKNKWYGLSIPEMPRNLSPRTIKKALEISEIISICDFIDAFLTRTTHLKDGGVSINLPDMLKERYPESELVINLALREYGVKI